MKALEMFNVNMRMGLKLLLDSYYYADSIIDSGYSHPVTGEEHPNTYCDNIARAIGKYDLRLDQ